MRRKCLIRSRHAENIVLCRRRAPPRSLRRRRQARRLPRRPLLDRVPNRSRSTIAQAGFGSTQLVSSVRVEATEMPMATRADRATIAMMRATAVKARQQALQKAGENKPTF
jgi:hypothetical protein